MEPVIYTQRVEIIKEYQERRDCADQRIADFISACGFLPVPVPNREAVAERLIERIRPVGIILTGGNSLTQYGGNAPERDAMDKRLIEIAVRELIPLYGFCRGMQSILNYFGNKLTDVEGHVALRHVIQGKMGVLEVNSYHNQACVQLSNHCGLNILAQTPDEVIEAVRHERFPIIGTMWHPEREKDFDINDINRVKKLFEEVA